MCTIPHVHLLRWSNGKQQEQQLCSGPTPPGGEAPAVGSDDEEDEEEDEGRCAILTLNAARSEVPL